MSRTAITLKFQLRWFPEEAGYSAEKEYTDINLPPLMSNEGKNISGSLVLLLTLIPFGNPLNYRKFGQLVHKHFQHS